MKGKNKITTFKDFHRLVPFLVEKISANKDLSIRALANPLLAFEELGYEISNEVKKQIELNLRFTRKERKQLKELENRIYKQIGRKIDLDSYEEIEHLLFKDIKLRKPRKWKINTPRDICKEGISIVLGKKVVTEDPLEVLLKKHPIVYPLVEYRKIKNHKAPFASRELFEQLKREERKLPVSKIKIKFRQDPRQHEVIDNA